jgi:predicted metal-dependent phosphotriesterase family hydrolase
VHHFIEEIEAGCDKAADEETLVKVGLIKIAFEESVEKTYQPGLIAAAQAAIQTGKILEIDTEQGMQTAKILDCFLRLEVSAHQIVLCHMDKRPDFGLYQELVRAGVLLEYDTFYRAKNEPKKIYGLLSQKCSKQDMRTGYVLLLAWLRAYTGKLWESAPGRIISPLKFEDARKNLHPQIR